MAAQTRAAERLEFTRMIAHWDGYADPGYLPFVEEAQPELVQVGFYGAHFWGLADTAAGSGYPANLPVRGHRAGGDWFADLNRKLHARGVKVIGHMNVKFLIGDIDGPEGPRGFFRFYDSQWDEKVLGAKPAARAVEFLEVDKKGKPLQEKNYGVGGMREYWACLNNPRWREVLKAWVRYAVGQGVDGLIANYFYRHDCHCAHCVREFRAYLEARFSPNELEKQFSMSDVKAKEFDEIVGWHEPAQSTPLRREMLRFSQIANKRAFDEVFVKYGRSIKPGLMVAQWNHLGDFSQISGDERCMLPAELWGRDEDYAWYSTGDSANRSDLKTGRLGEGTLQARYIRGALSGKPFTLGKYEATRVRMAISELAANGGAPMGFYTNFRDPDTRREIVRYYQFLKKHDALFRANRPAGEVLLLFPRTRVHQGDVAAVAEFKRVGQRLLDEHVLFDVLPDDADWRAVKDTYLEVIDAAGSKVPANLSRFEAPATVRVSASRPARTNGWTLHFVNYNRQEGENRGSGIRDEKPIAVASFGVDLKLPEEARIQRVEFLAPETSEAQSLPFAEQAGRLRFRMPSFLVYGIAHVTALEKEKSK